MTHFNKAVKMIERGEECGYAEFQNGSFASWYGEPDERSYKVIYNGQTLKAECFQRVGTHRVFYSH